MSIPISDIKDNFRTVLETANASTWNEGEEWYKAAREWCSNRANSYGMSWDRVAAIVAVLSPQLRWGKNLEAAEDVCANRDTRGILQNSLKKAYRIKDGENFFDLVDSKRSPKVYNFYLSILGSPISVCIDGQMYRVGYGGERVCPTYKRYQDIAFAVRWLSREVGIPASKLQAVIWCAQRRNRVD